MIADLHVHTSLKPYGSSHPGPLPNANICELYENPAGNTFIETLSQRLKFGIVFDSQSNLSNLYTGDAKVIFISIYPLEKGFVTLDPQSDFIKKLLNFLGIDGKKLIAAVTGLSVSKVLAIREGADYFTECVNEYKYIVDQSKLSPQGMKFKIANNCSDIDEAVSGENSVAVILTIEGAHVFGTGTEESETLTEDQLTERVTNNIAAIKQWQHPPFFISLMHHFWNQMGGFARSLTNPISGLINQIHPRMDEGLSTLGKQTIRELLSVENGRRIYIDIKHMSIRSRMDFYKLLDDEYADDDIPVICSHTGISVHRETLQAFAEEMDDTDRNNEFTYLHNWSINMCKEDVEQIYKRGGLIGIQLDEKRLGGGRAHRALKQVEFRFNHPGRDRDPIGTKEQYRDEYLRMLVTNIFTAVDFIGKKEAWDLICIGSDFDGVINPIDFYEDGSDLKKLSNELTTFLENKIPIEGICPEPERYKKYMFDYTAEQIVEKIMYGNVEKFLNKYFNNAPPSSPPAIADK